MDLVQHPIPDAGRSFGLEGMDVWMKCLVCEVIIVRGRLPCGSLERLDKFKARKYCSIVCAGVGRSLAPKKVWTEGYATGSRSEAYRQCAYLLPLGPCNRCGSEYRIERHHKDEDWRNNFLSNLELICRSCHRKEHWRLGTYKHDNYGRSPKCA